MRDLVLKMVQEGILTSENANKILAVKRGVDPIYKALSRGMIDEKKLAKFYEKEGYPVIYDEGRGPMADEFFTRFFTPDVIVRHLVVPISFKKENKDIIVGFINSALIPNVKETIKCIFPEFNTTFFHIPHSIFRKIVAKHFLFDIEKYTSVLTQMEISGEIYVDREEIVNSSKKKLMNVADQVLLLEIEEDGSILFNEKGLVSRFPLKSLPVLKEGFERGYMNMVPGDNLGALSHTEKILIFTNLGVKKDDTIMITAADENKKSFFLLVNPSVPKVEIESLIG